MKTRVLELLKEPKNIQKEDLQILKDQINDFPYLQAVRALHLYGVHLYDSENYKKELSKTAAYTTDKKNLYHLINGTIETRQVEITLPKPTQAVEDKKPYPAYVPKNGGFPLRRPEEKQQAETEDSPYTAVQPLPEITNQTVEVEGQRNRILFEGEENFLNEENTVKIDLESSMESGNLVTEKLNPSSETRIETSEKTIGNQSDINRLADESEIKVSPDNNLDEAADVILEDKAISFQEIAPLENEVKDEKAFVQNEVPDQTDTTSVTILSEEKIEADVKNQKADDFQSETDDVAEVNFDQSEIKVSPDSNLEEAVDVIAEDQAISFQEIAPLETEIKEEINIEKTFAQDEVSNQTDFTSETIIAEDKIESEQEKQKVEDDSQLSFHGTESFLPEVKIESKTPAQQEIPVQESLTKNKYEEEMRRLIEQVELKMKEAKKETDKNEKAVEKEETDSNSEISFAETQSFEVEKQSPEIKEEKEEILEEEKVSENESSGQSSETKALPEEKTDEAAVTTWKPMSFESNALDSLIGKKAETVEQKSEEKHQPAVEEQKPELIQEEEPVLENKNVEEKTTVEVNENVRENVEEKEEPAQAFNVSFFGNSISSFIKSNQQNEAEVDPETEPEPIPQTKIQHDKREIPSILDSNVPGFINTWQSWLKIDRSAEIEKEKTEIKEKAIEAFIENNPKISQLKDESSFVIKERTDDISHLMTETLANLYTEQKLYSKAIQAYQILIGKYPDKQSYFEEKIQEVKDVRGR